MKNTTDIVIVGVIVIILSFIAGYTLSEKDCIVEEDNVEYVPKYNIERIHSQLDNIITILRTKQTGGK